MTDNNGNNSSFINFNLTLDDTPPITESWQTINEKKKFKTR